MGGPYAARHWVTQRAVGGEGTEKANRSAAGPQPNRCGGIKIFARGKESTG